MSDKTEEPTPRRVKKARDEGDSGASSYASQAVAFLLAVALVPATGREVYASAIADLHLAFERAARATAVLPLLDPGQLAKQVSLLVAPLLVTVGVAGGVAQALQTGGIVSVQRLVPKFDRLDPAAGLGRLFSSTRLFAVLRSLLAGVITLGLAWQLLVGHAVDLARTIGRERSIGTVVSELAMGLAWRAAVLGLVLGVLDLLVSKRAWRRRLRMSPEEVKREHRDAEGDPQLKGARERAHHEMLAQATLANVKNASVVVVNPTHLACALRYDVAAGHAAPVVVVNGEGAFAERIVRAARDHHVPVVRDVPLAHALVELAVGDSIPEVLYETVAEILREVGPTP